MGSVYEGTHLPSRRPVAVKVLDPKLARHPAHLERFRREAETTSRLGHPNIVRVERFDHEGSDVAFYVMERLHGVPLSALLRREGRVPIERAVDLVCQALEGLGAAHRADVIHRDLKPANLFLTTGPNGEDVVKIVDFGLAKLLTSDVIKLTVTGSVIGTSHYLSPEQALGRATTPRSDLFACGVILYELLAGKRPFDGVDVATLMKNILRAEPARLDEVAPEVPRPLADAVHRALSRRPAERFGTADSMRRALLDAISEPGLLSLIPKPRKKHVTIVAVLGVAAVFGLVVAVAVDLGLTYFVGAEHRTARGSAEEPPAAVVPIPSSNSPLPATVTVTVTAPAPLGIEVCDDAARVACACPSPAGPPACTRANRLINSYRDVYRADPSAVPTIETGCRYFLENLDASCRP